MFLYDSKEAIGVPEETQFQMLCSIDMTCQCRFPSEPENNPYLAAYIEQGSYLPGHFSNPLMNEKEELLSGHIYPTHIRSISQHGIYCALELPLQLAVVLSIKALKF